MKKRVVVTGLGVVSSIGIGKDEFWKNLVNGRSGISKVETFDTSLFEIKVGGEVKNFELEKFIPKRQASELGRASQFAVAATQMALEDAGIEKNNINETKRDIAVIFGTTMGEGGMIEEIDKHWVAAGEEDVWGKTVAKYPANAIPNNVSRFFNINGMSVVIPTACAAGNYAIGYGYDLLLQGSSDVAIVGGADPFSRIGFTGFGRLFAMSPDVCRPFDKNRKGMILGEGSGVLIIEELEHARKRGANIYAEILGYGLSCDAYHMNMPSVEGVKRVMVKALKDAGLKSDDVDYISAHGTGTLLNDKTESQAIKEVFGANVKSISVNSIKSMLGHTMGAASAIEAINCCLTVKEDIVAPTINYESPDPECDIDCVPNKSKKKKVNIALNNSFAFGGNNACLVVKKYEN